MGLVGAGGGFLIIPMLVFFGGLPMKKSSRRPHFSSLPLIHLQVLPAISKLLILTGSSFYFLASSLFLVYLRVLTFKGLLMSTSCAVVLAGLFF
jgi:uncharacterized membrane protein YfcA